MNAILRIPRRIAATLVLGVVVAGCASGPSPPPADLLQRIESARTQADQESIAIYYDQEAAAARASAAAHRKVAASYQRIGGVRTARSMVAHCNALVSSEAALTCCLAGKVKEGAAARCR